MLWMTPRVHLDDMYTMCMSNLDIKISGFNFTTLQKIFADMAQDLGDVKPVSKSTQL